MPDKAAWLKAVSGRRTAVGQTARGRRRPNADAVSIAAQAAGETVK